MGLIGTVLFIAASTAQAGWLFVLAAAVLGLVAGSLLLRHNVDAIEITRVVAPHVRVEDQARVGLTVRNTGDRPIALARLEDSLPAFPSWAAVCENLGPGETAHLETVLTAQKRGVYPTGEVRVISGAPFGLTRARRTQSVGAGTIVVPRWVELASFPILEPSSFPFETLHARARTGAGEEYLGVREYRPGDPPRAVHWRSTARVGRLVVREYQEEMASPVSLVLYGPDRGEAPDSAFEYCVSAVASIARYALMTGHRVELARATPDGSVEEGVGLDTTGVLAWLAAAEPITGALDSLVGHVLKRAGRRGTVVFVGSSDEIHELSPALAAVQSAGCRSIAIVARGSSWDPTVSADHETGWLSSIATRTSVRTLDRGEDLARCLQA
jgi:uncharacterized protein (DUF58 family)